MKEMKDFYKNLKNKKIVQFCCFSSFSGWLYCKENEKTVIIIINLVPFSHAVYLQQTQ